MQIISKNNCVYAMDPHATPHHHVDVGETFLVETSDCFTGQLQSAADQLTELDWDRINPATGPIFINDAAPGDILVVHIKDIELVGHAVMVTGKDMGVLGAHYEENTTTVLQVADHVLHFNEHIHIPIRPMIGVIGTAPKEEAISCGTPGEHGGNMDCKEMIAGVTLYLPVFHPGALLSLGDLHAVMADGEVCVCGSEIDGRVTLSCDLIKNGMAEYPYPMLFQNSRVMVIDSKETLEEAIQAAVLKSRDYLVCHQGFDAEEAYRFLSLVGDVRICQVVDPLQTVRVDMDLSVLANRSE